MSGATVAVVLAFAAQASSVGTARVVVDPPLVALGAKLEWTFETEAEIGAALRLGGRLDLDPAFVLLDQASSPADATDRTARLIWRLQACAPGRFDPGPFAFVLRMADGAEQRLESEVFQVDVQSPWAEGFAPPPFAEWRRPEREPPTPTKGRQRIVIGAILLAVVSAWVYGVRRRRGDHTQGAPRPEPSEAGRDRALLREPLPSDFEARRVWGARVEALLRVEFMTRSERCDYAWTLPELLAASGAGAWPLAQQGRWSQLLDELEHARFAADGAARLAADLGVRLANALDEGDR